MHRRSFLTGLAVLAANGRAIAQMKMDGMQDMPGMDMGGHAGHDMPQTEAGPITLAEGKPLRDLPRLTNEAVTPGAFKGTLTAEPAVARFAEGLDTPILAYNGMSPGPLIEV